MMGRSAIGAALMAALLIIGVEVQKEMNQIHAPIAAELIQASQLAAAGRWETAGELAQGARQSWEEARRFTASFADHQPLEDIESLFAQLNAYAAQEDITFCAVCADLSRRVAAVAEAHQLTVSTFF